MKTGDICRVISQPRELLPCILGEHGFIDDIVGDYASFQAMRLDGSIKGCGSVPLKSLERIEDPAWHRAKKIHDDYMETLLQEAKDRTKRWEAKIDETATKYSVDREKIKSIYAELAEYHTYLR